MKHLLQLGPAAQVVATLLVLGPPVLGAAESTATSFIGDGTTFRLESTPNGNCNLMEWPTFAMTRYAGVPMSQWNGSHACGRCAEVWCDGPECPEGDGRALVYVVDQCLDCGHSGLNLSPEVMQELTQGSGGKHPIRWQFADCPLRPEDTKLCVRTGSNPYWVAIQPVLDGLGIVSIAINGRDAEMMDSAYYYKVDESDGFDIGHVELTLTTRDDQRLERVLSAADGHCVPLSMIPSTADAVVGSQAPPDTNSDDSGRGNDDGGGPTSNNKNAGGSGQGSDSDEPGPAPTPTTSSGPSPPVGKDTGGSPTPEVTVPASLTRRSSGLSKSASAGIGLGVVGIVAVVASMAAYRIRRKGQDLATTDAVAGAPTSSTTAAFSTTTV